MAGSFFFFQRKGGKGEEGRFWGAGEMRKRKEKNRVFGELGGPGGGTNKKPRGRGAHSGPEKKIKPKNGGAPPPPPPPPPATAGAGGEKP